MGPEALPEPVAVALEFAAVLETLGIPYVTAGSFASSLYGEPRTTNDVDVVASVRAEHVVSLADALAERWVVSEDALQDAVASGTSFNAVHVPTALKVDVFVVGDDAFDAHRVANGARVRIADGPAGELFVDAAEHTVVRKLEWFRRGGEVSDTQWRDVVGILRAQGARLNQQTMDTWAQRVGVADLLDVARRQAQERA